MKGTMSWKSRTAPQFVLTDSMLGVRSITRWECGGGGELINTVDSQVINVETRHTWHTDHGTRGPGDFATNDTSWDIWGQLHLYQCTSCDDPMVRDHSHGVFNIFTVIYGTAPGLARQPDMFCFTSQQWLSLKVQAHKGNPLPSNTLNKQVE